MGTRRGRLNFNIRKHKGVRASLLNERWTWIEGILILIELEWESKGES